MYDLELALLLLFGHFLHIHWKIPHKMKSLRCPNILTQLHVESEERQFVAGTSVQ